MKPCSVWCWTLLLFPDALRTYCPDSEPLCTWVVSSHCGKNKNEKQTDFFESLHVVHHEQCTDLMVLFCMAGPVICVSLIHDLFLLSLSLVLYLTSLTPPLNTLSLLTSASSLRFPPSTAAACFLRRYVQSELLCCTCCAVVHRVVYSKYVVDCSVSAWMIFVTVGLFDRGTSENLEAEVVHSHRQLSLLLWIHHSEYDCVTLMDTSTSKHFITCWSLGFYYSDLLLYFSLN